MWIALAALAVAFLGGGVAGSLLLHAGRLAAPEANMLLLVQNLAISAGIGLALAAAALAHRKLSHMGRVMSGRTLSSRLRRTRIQKRAQEEAGGPEGEAEGPGV